MTVGARGCGRDGALVAAVPSRIDWSVIGNQAAPLLDLGEIFRTCSAARAEGEHAELARPMGRPASPWRRRSTGLVATLNPSNANHAYDEPTDFSILQTAGKSTPSELGLHGQSDPRSGRWGDLREALDPHPLPGSPSRPPVRRRHRRAGNARRGGTGWIPPRTRPRRLGPAAEEKTPAETSSGTSTARSSGRSRERVSAFVWPPRSSSTRGDPTNSASASGLPSAATTTAPARRKWSRPRRPASADATESSGLAYDEGAGTVVAGPTINLDGDLDLYRGRRGPSRPYRNEGSASSRK